jgi:hypothetical protein
MIARLSHYAVGVALMGLFAVPVFTIFPAPAVIVYAAAEGLDIKTATADQFETLCSVPTFCG